jgi:hypothetical protein
VVNRFTIRDYESPIDVKLRPGREEALGRGDVGRACRAGGSKLHEQRNKRRRAVHRAAHEPTGWFDTIAMLSLHETAIIRCFADDCRDGGWTMTA